MPASAGLMLWCQQQARELAAAQEKVQESAGPSVGPPSQPVSATDAPTATDEPPTADEAGAAWKVISTPKVPVRAIALDGRAEGP